MDSNQLFKYVSAKYGLKFQPAFPGSSSVYVLISPVDKSYFAILSRGQRQTILDLKCGVSLSFLIRDLPGFTAPNQIKGEDWVGAILDNENNNKAIEKALDAAFKVAMNGDDVGPTQKQYFYIPADEVDEKYKSQPIMPRTGSFKKKSHNLIPKQIRKMLEIYDYSILPSQGRAKNFYHQGFLMANYEDDYPESYAFKRFYPVYHDMNIGQLRNYFTWRSKIRKNIFEKTSTSYACVYIYELLNNIGVKNPQDGYDKLLSFDQNYVAKFDLSIDVYLKDWLKDYVLYYDLSDKIKQNFAKEIKDDHDYLVLHHPENFSARQLAEVFARKTTYWTSSKTINQHKALFTSILYCVWQEILDAKKYGLAYYSTYVAKTNIIEKPLFASSVFYQRHDYQVVNHEIDPIRKYHYYQGQWQIHVDQAVKKQRTNLNTFLHELDRIGRVKFKLGRPIKARFIDQAVLKAINQGINNYYQQEKRDKINQIKIDFSNLDQIRENASKTRDSLLTDEEKALEQEEQIPKKKDNQNISFKNDYDLSKDEMFLLTALLLKKPWKDYVKEHHLMSSILMDNINDKLFDEFGDVVLENNDQDEPQVIDDYVEDLTEIFLKGMK